MSIDKVAILTINKILDSPTVKADIIFDWSAFELDMRNPQWSQETQWGHSLQDFPEGDIQAIHSTLIEGIINDNKLKGIGYRIWDLFPEDIQTELKRFDLYAEEVYNKSKSILPLIIFTNLLTIPWELCITRREDLKPEEQKNWFRQYMVSIEIYGISNLAEKIKSKRKNKVALILKPFKALDDREMLSFYNEENFLNEYNHLLELKDKIEKKEEVEISLHECPKNIEDLLMIQDTLAKGEYDLILYLGSYESKQGIILEDPGTEKPKYFDIKKIGINRDREQCIFLDACSTCINRYKDQEIVKLNCEVANFFFEKGASAFIGTIQDIQPTVAAVFVKYFLQSLFLWGRSLSKAMYDSRKQTYDYFTYKLPNEMYKIQSSSFSLYGRNNDILLNSFMRRRKRMTLIFSEMIAQYFKGFSSYIYPDSIPGIALSKKHNLQGVVDEIELTNKPFIADISILRATNLISKYKEDKEKEIVIIGGLFRLQSGYTDNTLYFVNDISNYNFFCSADPLSSLTAMALSYFLSTGEDIYEHFKHKSSHRRMEYEDICYNVINSIEDNNYNIEPFILAATYKKRFDDELEKRNLKSKFNRVYLYPKFLNILKEKYPKYTLFRGLPAEVLVTRKKDIEKDVELYKEIFAHWAKWQVESEDEFLKGQELIFFLTEEDVNSITNFTEFVYEKLTDSFIKIKESLNRNRDFVILQPQEEEVTPKYEIKKEWLEEAINEAKQCKSEDGEIHPKVGAVIVKNGKIIASAHRNERGDGDHAESIVLKKCGDPDLKDAIMITTLEPCTSRKHKAKKLPKISCADYIMHVGIKRVVIGIPDPNPAIRRVGDFKLRAQGIIVDYFPGEIANKLLNLNRDFIKKFKNK